MPLDLDGNRHPGHQFSLADRLDHIEHERL